MTTMSATTKTTLANTTTMATSILAAPDATMIPALVCDRAYACHDENDNDADGEDDNEH